MDGRKRKLWLLFVGNGVYRSPRPLAAPARAELSSGLLDVWLLDAHWWAGRRQLAGHLARVAGMPENLPLPERHLPTRLDLDALSGLRYAYDGEVADAPAAVRLEAAPAALRLYLPTCGT
ncbi:hypothetical protein [Streptomyces sp. HYC2]|uniref:hypothetical protein n=1 Tax=Streptomyces sp. HYC2 TaxID=2955207 RepID=UPI00248078F6|nr:hypothetical protein [Streptomyces sp. HYC2]